MWVCPDGQMGNSEIGHLTIARTASIRQVIGSGIKGKAVKRRAAWPIMPALMAGRSPPADGGQLAPDWSLLRRRRHSHLSHLAACLALGAGPRASQDAASTSSPIGQRYPSPEAPSRSIAQIEEQIEAAGVVAQHALRPLTWSHGRDNRWTVRKAYRLLTEATDCSDWSKASHRIGLCAYP